MPVDFEASVEDFLAKHGALLSQHAAEHSLILSLCQMAQQKAAGGERFDIRIATLLDDEGFVCAAVQTPPHNIVLSRARHTEVAPLVEALAEKKFSFPGIVGPSDIAGAFTTLWTEKTGEAPHEYMDQVIYALETVLMPAPVPGRLRWAKPSEADIAARWLLGFSAEALPTAERITPDNAAKKAREMTQAGRLAFWEVEGTPVAQAGASGTKDVARISIVYTPEEQRGKGYAAAVVAHLSQLMLDQGKKFCCLYADARNPVSNSIYRKIGYQFIGRSSLYVLGK